MRADWEEKVREVALLRDEAAVFDWLARRYDAREAEGVVGVNVPAGICIAIWDIPERVFAEILQVPTLTSAWRGELRVRLDERLEDHVFATTGGWGGYIFPRDTAVTPEAVERNAIGFAERVLACLMLAEECRQECLALSREVADAR